MPRYIFFLTLFTLIFPHCLFSQSAQNNVDYSEVDNFSATVKYHNDIKQLTNKLVTPFSRDLLKARAIFKWITENIRYDYTYYNKYNYKGRELKIPKCRDDQDCDAKRIVWEANIIDKALRKKKAVCQGYSLLFKKMCDIAGLKSQIVTGYVRTEYYQVGSAGTLDHAWNVVWLDSAYFLLDATWAAGGCWKDEDGKLTYYQKNFNGYYWLTPAKDFARNHYPEKKEWSLIPNYTKENFAANPYYSSNIISAVKVTTPSSGIVAAKKGDTIHFKLNYQRPFQDLQINSNLFRNPDIWAWDEVAKRKRIRRLDTLAIKKQQYTKYKQNGSDYEFEYIVTDNSLYYLDILFDKQRVMRFKVVTSK